MTTDKEIRRARRAGVDETTISLAVATQTGQRRAGLRPQPLADIIAGKQRPTPRAKGADVVPLSARQHRQRGVKGQIALTLHELAATETDPAAAAALLEAAAIVRVVAQPVQLVFNFFKGNFSVSDQYLDAVMAQLKTHPRRLEAIAVLNGLMRFVGRLDPESKFGTQEELGAYVGMQRPHVTRALKLLEDIGAIRRVKKGRATRVYINPEGVYRGGMDKHAETVASYAKVVELHPKGQEESDQVE